MLSRESRAFLSAVEFLTRLPVPGWTGWEAGRLDRAAAYFPAVGLLVGLIAAAAFSIASALFPAALAALVAVSASVLVTGALHEDGLADLADGMGGGRNREDILRIMKDSRIGSYGTIALGLVVGGMVISLSGLTPAYGVCALIAAHGTSRYFMRAVALGLDYARPVDEQTSAPLSKQMTPARHGMMFLFALCSLLPAIAFAPIQGVILAAIFGFLAALILRVMIQRALGGWTGDCLGAAQQLTALGFLIGASTWMSI